MFVDFSLNLALLSIDTTVRWGKIAMQVCLTCNIAIFLKRPVFPNRVNVVPVWNPNSFNDIKYHD